MRPFKGATVLYRDFVGDEFIGTITHVYEDGFVDLVSWRVQFPGPVPGDTLAVFTFGAHCKGWAHTGSDPTNPPANTWRWLSLQHELGPQGADFFRAMMADTRSWHSLLCCFQNMAEFRKVYNERREAAIAQQWPELPDEPAPASDSRPVNRDGDFPIKLVKTTKNGDGHHE